MPIIDAVLGDFFWRALIGGLGVALIAGPLGCFVVWRRMALCLSSTAGRSYARPLRNSRSV